MLSIYFGFWVSGLSSNIKLSAAHGCIKKTHSWINVVNFDTDILNLSSLNTPPATLSHLEHLDLH